LAPCPLDRGVPAGSVASPDPDGAVSPALTTLEAMGVVGKGAGPFPPPGAGAVAPAGAEGMPGAGAVAEAGVTGSAR
jgi:hypothetical protein